MLARKRQKPCKIRQFGLGIVEEWEADETDANRVINRSQLRTAKATLVTVGFEVVGTGSPRFRQ